MPRLPQNFGLLPLELADPARSRVAVLPVPLERTTSYGKGTYAGPDALLRASHALELYDEELECEPAQVGIATAEPFVPQAHELSVALREIEAECQAWMAKEKFVVTLGGEHSLSLAPVRAARAVFGELGIVQFDAHADLREEFEGTPYSHACIMRRLHEERFPILSIGIRSLSREEAEFVKANRPPILWGHELESAESHLPPLLQLLPSKVYLTFDVDFFDPSLVPATGTPEPGGGWWYPTLRLLRMVFETKQVVACDVVELAPIGGQPASDFVAAKLTYKLIGYWARSQGLV